MVMGWDDAIGGGFAVAGGIMNLLNQGKQNQTAAEQLQLARLNQMLQWDQAQKQYEMATASRTDARGNKISYAPGVGWTTKLTPGTRDAIGASDAVERMNVIDTLFRGKDERDMAYRRRLEEGSASSPLLKQLMFGYGMPTKEGVVGAKKIADVTGVSENADNAKSGYSTMALRSGTSVAPTNFSNIDTGTTTGIRKALANVDANANPMVDAAVSSKTATLLNPYNTLASRASNVENIPFAPNQQGANLDASMANASVSGNSKIASGSDAMYRGFAPLMGAAGLQKPISYDAFAGGIGGILAGILKKNSGGAKPYEGVPWNEDSRNPSAFNNWSW